MSSFLSIMLNTLSNSLLLFAFFLLIRIAHLQPTSGKLPSSTTTEPSPTPALSHVDRNKYFHEPGGHEPGEDDRLGHYDTRYFHGLVSLKERTETLTHMVRAYLTTFQMLGLETWIAHGTLLGWWWNGKVCKQNTLVLELPAYSDEDSTMGLGCRYSSLRRDTAVHG